MSGGLIMSSYTGQSGSEINSLQDSTVTMVQIRNISEIVHRQQQLSDKNYQRAIENTFSHEQMTPLNYLLGNAQLLSRNFLDMFTKMTKLRVKCFMKDK